MTFPCPDEIPAKVNCNRTPVLIIIQGPYAPWLEESIFPEILKLQHLTLISKSKGDTETPLAYRSLSMLDKARKLLKNY